MTFIRAVIMGTGPERAATMRFRTLTVVAVALLVTLSGCGALEGATTNDSPTENETSVEIEDADADEQDETQNDSDTETPPTDTEETDETDDTADAEWTPPEEPNRPLEDKREDRIERVEFVDTVPAADGEGYSNFNLEVVANTSMESVDPPEHGDVVGEPYFFVKINEGPGNRKIVERTEQVRMEENGTFHIDVRPAGIEEFGEGPLTVEVFLMDEDKDWDDIYDAVGTDIHFNPETDDADGETESDTDGSEDGDDTDGDDSTGTDTGGDDGADDGDDDSDDTESSET